MRSSETKAFNHDRAQQIAEELADTLNAHKAPAVEQVYALMAVLRWIGEALYDKENTDLSAVVEDFEESPTWPAALIIISSLPHDVRERLIKERDNPGSELKELAGDKYNG